MKPQYPLTAEQKKLRTMSKDITPTTTPAPTVADEPSKLTGLSKEQCRTIAANLREQADVIAEHIWLDLRSVLNTSFNNRRAPMEAIEAIGEKATAVLSLYDAITILQDQD